MNNKVPASDCRTGTSVGKSRNLGPYPVVGYLPKSERQRWRGFCGVPRAIIQRYSAYHSAPSEPDHSPPAAFERLAACTLYLPAATS
jgi:hypothetical protein